jgi:adenylate cyclase
MMKRLMRPTPFKLAVVVALLFAGLHMVKVVSRSTWMPALDLLDTRMTDLKFKWRGPLPLSHKVALAAIDEKSVLALGRWPWDRGVFAAAMRNLAAAEPASVALDLIFADPQNSVPTEKIKALQDRLGSATPDPALTTPEGLQRSLAQVVEESGDLELGRVFAANPDLFVLGVILEPPNAQTQSKQAQWLQQIKGSSMKETWLFGEDGKLKPDGQPLATLRFEHTLPNVQGWLKEIAHGSRRFGFFTNLPDGDGTMRSHTPLLPVDGRLMPSLAFQAIAAAAHSRLFARRTLEQTIGEVAYFDDASVSEGGFSKPIQVPLDSFSRGKMLVNYIGGPKQWLDADDVGPDGKPLCQGVSCDAISLSDLVENKFDPANVKGKIVFVGATALGTFDQRITPLDNFIPGVFVHMNVAEDVITRRFLRHDWDFAIFESVILIFLGLIYGFLMPRLRLSFQVLQLPLIAVIYIGFNFLLFKNGYQLFLSTPLLEMATLTFALIVFQYLTVDKEKRQIRGAFQKYLTASVMEEMLQDPSKLQLGGVKKELTVFFSDIRGFTTLSEALSPVEVSKMLNEYLTPMTDLVFHHEGTLDKYMGDAIMAFWGAPIDQQDHALRACKTAIEMLQKLDVLRAGWKAQGKPDIDIGIGLNSGPISVGNMGSTRLFNYTVIGDDVNLASRLEGTNKTYGTRIILGEKTYLLVKGQVVARELGGVQVKGKLKPVTIYELRAMGTAPEAEAQVIATFESGLAAYRARRWDDAERCFHDVQKAWPGDGPSEKYLDDIADKRADPPPEGWDGTYVMKTK